MKSICSVYHCMLIHEETSASELIFIFYAFEWRICIKSKKRKETVRGVATVDMRLKHLDNGFGEIDDEEAISLIKEKKV